MLSEALKAARAYEAAYAPFIQPEQRPAYHLTPYIGWMNDPNGFSYYQGKYHIFYQYHPYSTKWGPMHWGHAVSEDLLHWAYLPCALAPDTGYDRNGCFSGSAAELPDGRQLLLYTGVRQERQPDGRMRDIQTQCIAVGNGLDYEKIEGNPVLDASSLPAGGSEVDFRDPKLWQEADGSFACVVGNRTADGSGAILLYRSADAFSWKYAGMVARCYNEYGKMWECPDFFRLDGKWVLLTSPQDMTASGLEFHNGNGTLYITGEFDRKTCRLAREELRAIDYGLDFYATQTTLAPDGRRILIAWMQNWDTCIPPSDQRWFGQLTVPRELRIRDGLLIQNPVRELEALRGHCVRHRITLNEETSLSGVYGRIVDLTITLQPCAGELYQRFSLKVAQGSQHYTLITYKPRTSVLRIDRSHSGFCRDLIHERRCLVRSQGGKLKLRVLLDRFSVEVFVNDGEQALSSVIYTPQTAEGISFTAEGQLQLEVEKYDLRIG